MIDFIGKRYFFLSFSGILVILSWLLVAIFGFKMGIDLKGGTQWHLVFPVNFDEKEISSFLKESLGHSNFTLKKSEETIILKLPPISEEEHQIYLKALKEKFCLVEEKSFSSIGPTIGTELRNKAKLAIILVLTGIALFISWSFRKASRVIKSWKYGLITLLTLFHDISLPIGFLVFLGWWRGIEIDTNFIVALLFIIGFSVHDTIVVFDRIREHLILERNQKKTLGEIINQSINETLARSINTSLTLIFVLMALIFFGPPSLYYFSLVILIGTIVGTYSSICVASPLLYLWHRS